MSNVIKAYGQKGPRQPFEEFTFEVGPIAPNEVEIKVTHCSICHSDVHILDEDWGKIKYPHAAGHEVVGEIIALGTNVNELKVGQRVGVGWQKASCQQCKYCKKEKENLCDNGTPTCASGNQGGFAERIRVDHRFAYSIPDSLPSEYAAPLLCAGHTVWNPLVEFGVNASHKVGIVGIGGLGHLAIQFAAKMGAEVHAFSSNKDKENEVKGFGAKGLILLNNEAEFTKHTKSFDFIVVTFGYADVDWSKFISLLARDGQICFLATPADSTSKGAKITATLASLFFNCERGILGSCTGSIKAMRAMLKFSAEHDIRPAIEKYSFSEIGKVFDRVREGKVKYRAVLIK